MLQFTIIGNLGADAEIKEWDGKKFSTFRIATTKKTKEKEETTWVLVSYFYNENFHPLLVKGQKVYVYGEGRLNMFTKQDGTLDAGLSVRADKIELCGSKPAQASQPTAQPTSGFDYVKKKNEPIDAVTYLKQQANLVEQKNDDQLPF
jgi:single-strand DNA-binding protein